MRILKSVARKPCHFYTEKPKCIYYNVIHDIILCSLCKKRWAELWCLVCAIHICPKGGSVASPFHSQPSCLLWSEPPSSYTHWLQYVGQRWPFSFELKGYLIPLGCIIAPRVVAATWRTTFSEERDGRHPVIYLIIFSKAFMVHGGSLTSWNDVKVNPKGEQHPKTKQIYSHKVSIPFTYWWLFWITVWINLYPRSNYNLFKHLISKVNIFSKQNVLKIFYKHYILDPRQNRSISAEAAAAHLSPQQGAKRCLEPSCAWCSVSASHTQWRKMCLSIEAHCAQQRAWKCDTASTALFSSSN